MKKKICRLCLCTNKTLRLLDKNLSNYFLEICDSTTRGSIKYLCCSACQESLRNNLDFRNRCQKSNRIFQEWEKDNNPEKPSMESLQKLLTETNTIEYLEITKFEEALIQSNYKEADNGNYNGIKAEIKVECDDGAIDSQSPGDNEFASNVVSKIKVKRMKKETSGIEEGEQVTKKYKLRGEIAKRSEFTQFDAVFDITLFATYAEARQELLARRLSEPYLSAPHRCELCYTVYKNDGLLQFHMKWHDLSADSSHECDVCSMRFASRGTLLKHKPNCHRGKFACKMCPLVTYQRQAMKAHFQKHQGKIFKCHCDRVFKHISSYMTHKRNVHASTHVCVTCARTFVSELGLRDHRLKMHPAECKVECAGAVRCEPCDLTFASQQVYTVHVLNTDAHKDIASELVACSVCGLAFGDPVHLKEHKKLTHARTQNPKNKLITLKNSTRKDHTNKEEKINDIIECKLCGAAGPRAAWLYRHHRRAHAAAPYEAPRGARQFLCELCGQGFYKKLQLEEHKYVHSGLKPFRCETCHKVFRTKMSLRNHGERHGAASRACAHCGKKFNSAANLSNHIRSHTGDRRFVCSHCGKGFLHRAALREHTRSVHLHIRRKRNTNKLL